MYYRGADLQLGQALDQCVGIALPSLAPATLQDLLAEQLAFRNDSNTGCIQQQAVIECRDNDAR